MTRLGVLVAVVALSPAAYAQSVAERLGDLRLATAVRLALVDDVRTRALDVSVVARRGSVEIGGELGRGDRATASEVARDVPGVQVVGGEATGRALVEPSGPRVQISPRATEAEASEVRPSRAEPRYHTVERGDTLFALARRYGTSVEALQALNGRPSDGIQVGQRLRVR